MSSLLQNSSFVTVIGDGSTDSSIKEQDLWYIRIVSERLEVKVLFIGVATLPKADSQHIVKGLQSIVEANLNMKWEDFTKKLVGIGCDGAAVMVGSKSGVATLLRKEQPSLLTIHCMAHRLELSLKDTIKHVPLSKKINTPLLGLYYFYHNSPLNRAMLARSFTAGKEQNDKLLMPTRVGGTRWVAHLVQALTNLTMSYKFIVTHLEQVSTKQNYWWVLQIF